MSQSIVSGTVYVAGETATDFGGPLFINMVINTSFVFSLPVGSDGRFYFAAAVSGAGSKVVLTNTRTNSTGNRLPGTYYVAEDFPGTINIADQTGSRLGEINIQGIPGRPLTGLNFRLEKQLPFDCQNGLAYQVAVPAGETTSSLYSYNVSSGLRTLIKTLPVKVNALTYSSAADNILWATVDGTNSLMRFGSEGSTVEFVVRNLPVGTYNLGTELPNGYMMISENGGANYYVIDVDPSRATYLELVDPANGFALKTGPNYGTTLSSLFKAEDFTYLSATHLCYGITAEGRIITINPLTGAVTISATVVTGLPAASYGAVFSDASGKLYAFNDTPGDLYQINPVTNTATFLSSSTAFSGTDAASCPTAQALPVTLVKFTAKQETAEQREVVFLNWATTRESNSDRFEIERSTDAKIWNTIARKVSSSESTVLANYDFTDTSPFEGINYYRLRMVDKDETFAYSRIQQVSFGARTNLSVYPNPATTSLTLSGKINGAVKIYNLSGQQVLQTEVKTEKTHIFLNKLPAGIYVIKSENGWNSKFIKN